MTPGIRATSKRSMGVASGCWSEGAVRPSNGGAVHRHDLEARVVEPTRPPPVGFRWRNAELSLILPSALGQLRRERAAGTPRSWLPPTAPAGPAALDAPVDPLLVHRTLIPDVVWIGERRWDRDGPSMRKRAQPTLRVRCPHCQAAVPARGSL